MEYHLCPCQSGLTYQDCCAPLHEQTTTAQTAEQLMRSRYAAYVMAKIDYLIETMHPSQRHPDDRAQLQRSIETTQWLGLQIRSHQQQQDQAEVEFIAFYQDNPIGQLHERSYFVRENDRWFYIDGVFLPPVKLGRNDPCFCGSGKKFKRCHDQLG